MPDRPDASAVKDILDELIGEFDKRTRDSLKEFLDLQRVIVEDYGKYVEDELARDNEILKHFTRLLVEQSALAVKTSRTHRTNVREMHSRLIDAHLKFIDHLKGQLTNDPPAPSPAPPPAAAPPPRASGKSRRKGR
jgi:hypothetical protein